MNQEEINALWLKEYDSNAGMYTILTPPRREVPGLRKPYEHEIEAATGKLLVHDLKTMLDSLDDNSLQCVLIDSKAIKYGIRLHIWLLGFAPGFTGEPAKGCNAQFWAVTTQWLSTKLRETLGDWTPVYVESWSAAEKFQARFETYIKYKEL